MIVEAKNRCDVNRCLTNPASCWLCLVAKGPVTLKQFVLTPVPRGIWPDLVEIGPSGKRLGTVTGAALPSRLADL
jgi:hypothetical protein